jgi:PAS domain S-box-containing protein
MKRISQKNARRLDIESSVEPLRPLSIGLVAKPGYAQTVVLLIVVAAVYLGAAKLGLSLASLHTSVSPVWPPTGIAIAAVLWLGYRVSPAILFGAFVANLATGVSMATAGGIAAGNTLEAVSAAFLIHRFIGFHSPFNRARDVLKFVLFAVLLTPMAAATIGNMSLCLGGSAAWANFGSLWRTWWIGDGVGALVVAPLVLTWVAKPSDPWPPRRVAEALLLLILLSSSATIFFREPLRSNFVNLTFGRLIIPFLLWAAFRLGPRGVATALGVFSGIAIWATRLGFGPFIDLSPNESLLLLQVTVAVNGITFLLLAGVVAERKSAEQTISFLASIVESTDDAVIGKTLDGIIVSWNDGARNIYGYAAEEVVGRSISMLVPADRADEIPRILDRLKSGEHIENYETVRVRKDGTQINISLTISTIKDASGKIVGASAIGRDITERRRAEENLRTSEELLRMALDAGKMGTWDYNVMTGEVRWSTNLEAIHGIAPGTFGGTFEAYLSDVYSEDREYVMAAIARSLANGAEHHIEYRIVWPDGSLHWLEGNGAVIQDSEGRAIRMTGACTDITERRRAEVEREQLLKSEKTARIEAEDAHRLSAELLMREQAARADAETANRAKDEFLAIVSHELRTPLNAIAGWVDILLGNTERDEALTARGLEVIKRTAGLQTRIIEDILDVSRIVTGKLQLEMRPVELNGIIKASIAAVQLTADTKKVRLRQVLDPRTVPVSGDPNRLQQIAWNLLSNAIKFTPSGGEVEIRLEQDGSSVRIIVSDTGEGIRTEFLPHIFDRFRQGDSSTTRRYAGLGLGLAIVRHLVELHGGAIEAYSAGENHGSVFTVTLPCPAAGAESLEQRSSADRSRGDGGRALAGLRLLIVDDDADSREVLATLLASAGAEVRSAAFVREALEALNEWGPHVLVSDIGMPDEDGYDLIRKVRALGAAEGGQIPAIALTGYADVQEVERALAEGYQMHMAKPVEPSQLVKMIASFGIRDGQAQGAQ